MRGKGWSNWARPLKEGLECSSRSEIIQLVLKQVAMRSTAARKWIVADTLTEAS